MKKNKKLVLAIFAFGIILRLLHWVLPVMDSDMAITGLMARHILKGEFPIFFWGQIYCGAIEAYLVAPVFAIFGASRYALNSIPVFLSILFVFIMYIMARRAFGEKVGVLTLLFTALPARYLIVNTVLARANYIENLILGAISFYLTYRIVYEEEGINSGKLFFMLGLVFGLAWWTNFQSIYYIFTSIFFIFLRRKLIFFTARFLKLILGVLIGGSPFWYFCIHSNFSPFKSLGPEKFSNIGLSLKHLFVVGLPILSGVIKSRTWIVYLPVLSYLLLLIYIFSFFYVLKDRFKGLVSLGRLSLKNTNGMEMFIVFFLLFSLIYMTSGYGIVNTRRYMLILYLSLPVYLAYFLARLSEKRKRISLVILAVILASNFHQNVVSIDLLDKGKREWFFQDKKNKENLHAFLKEKDIKYVYVSSYWRSYGETFDLKEKVIFTEFNPSRYPPYFEGAKNSQKVAFCFPGQEGNFDKMLEIIGTESYKKENIVGLTLYYNFKQTKRNYKAIDLSEAILDSNFMPDEIGYALDKNLKSRWTTKVPQEAGMYFQLDLGRIEEIARIILELNASGTDFPRSWRLVSSLDGQNWQEVINSPINLGPLHWGRYHPIMNITEPKTEMCFKPHSARFIRLELTGGEEFYWWSIHEIKLYGEEASRVLNE